MPSSPSATSSASSAFPPAPSSSSLSSYDSPPPYAFVKSGPERVLVAMSGGVDSSVAAARLKSEGHEVIGCTLHLWDYPEQTGTSPARNRCCAPEDQYDAKRTADALGFAHYTFDRRDLFRGKVVTPFVNAYLEGITPSPCAMCNQHVKLHELFEIATRLGATKIATGHYARVVEDESGKVYIARGLDLTKDQSYFLYATPEKWIKKLLFPLGESHKQDVRQEAIERQLPGATKGESQELCFVGQGAHAYANFVESQAKSKIRPGPILSENGETLGHHEGIHRFTIGQHKGLGLRSGARLGLESGSGAGQAQARNRSQGLDARTSAQALPSGKKAFVTKIDASSNAIYLGTEATALETEKAFVYNTVFTYPVTFPLRASVQIRYRHVGQMARIQGKYEGGPDCAEVQFDRPLRAVTKGQIAVFYNEKTDHVLGGGTIG